MPFYLKLRTMKTKLYPLLCLTFLLSLLLQLPQSMAQEHFPDYFELESEITLSQNSCAAKSGKLIGCMEGDALYLCNAEVVSKRKKGGVVTVERWNLTTRAVSTYKLILPPRSSNPLVQNRYWLYAISVSGQRLLLTTSGLLYEYELSHSGSAKILHTYDFPDADFSYFDRQGIKAVAQINDVGFRLLQPTDGKLTTVADLPLPAPFLLQFRPNALLQPCGDHLFFIPTPSPTLKILNPQGEELSETALTIPNWTPMPESYINEIQAMPYSGARAMHIFQTSTPYSFPMELFVLDDSTFLLSYHQYDSASASLTTPFLLLNTDQQGRLKRSTLLRANYEDEHHFTGNEYPFYYANRALSLMLTGNQRIVQVMKTSDEPYTGRTLEDYETAQQRFFADHPPIIKIRVLRMKPQLPLLSCKELPLVDAQGEPLCWDSLPHRHAVVVVNSAPQCHACEEGIYRCLNGMNLPEGVLYIAERQCPDQLCHRERLQQIRRQLTAPFTPLYVRPADEEKLTQLLGRHHYPLVLLIDKETGDASILSDSQLFPDEPTRSDVRPEAQRAIIRHLR